ncbi:MAG: tetratricopeptide repeat protein, partial [Anaerolineae bacterium]
AIACYQRALEVYTRADFPADWAMTQNNLGAAYRNRIRGDRAENLEEAIACFQRALEVLGRPDMLPEWAEIVRNNLQRAQQELAALAGGAGASE